MGPWNGEINLYLALPPATALVRKTAP